MHFSAKFVNKNPMSVKENLLKEYYRYPSLTPENPLVPRVIPAAPGEPILQKEGKNIVLSWQKKENNSMFVVYQYKMFQRKRTDRPDKIISVTSCQKILLNAAKGYNPARYRYVVTALSPSHAESIPVKFKKK
jgi:hypothetical protein